MEAIRLARTGWAVNGLLLVTLAVTACAPGAAPTTSSQPAAPPSSESKTLVAMVGAEPASIATRGLATGGGSLRLQQRLPNALLAVIDAKGLPQPELLASLPALNTPSWQVFPDGTMQTTYTLRPNLTWHDGQPLTPDDFIFAFRVYSSAELGQANQPPFAIISEVTGIDRQTFTIKWKRTFPDADNLSYTGKEFPPLPQHLLAPAFEKVAAGDREGFVSQPYWSREFVGLGPYRITNWESGSFIQFTRFEGYALGTPKIGKVEMRFGKDANTVIASMLSGAVHFAPSLDSIEGLKPEWARTNEGRFLDTISSMNAMVFQMRPEYANPSAQLDPRFRRAVAHMVDKQTLVDTIYGGQGILTDTLIWTGSQWGPAMDSSVPTYPFDLRAAEGLLNQAGFTKGPDGFYRGAEGRLSPLEVSSTGVPDKVQLATVLTDWFKSNGLDAIVRTIPSAQQQDNEIRSTFPGVHLLSSGSSEAGLTGLLASTSVSSPSNRWIGNNRGGWVNPEYDRLLATFSTTLDRGERIQPLRQMLRIYSEELPFVSINFSVGNDAIVNALKGPTTVAPESNVAWGIHLWELQ